jgi:hypothetical protein
MSAGRDRPAGAFRFAVSRWFEAAESAVQRELTSWPS